MRQASKSTSKSPSSQNVSPRFEPGNLGKETRIFPHLIVPLKRNIFSVTNHVGRLHICSVGEQEFGDFVVPLLSCNVERRLFDFGAAILLTTGSARTTSGSDNKHKNQGHKNSTTSYDDNARTYQESLGHHNTPIFPNEGGKVFRKSR